MAEAPLSIAWSHGRAEVQRLGGMVGPAWFDLPDGRRVQPFAVAPWAAEAPPPGAPALPGLMRRLRGEWPCVPFGAPAVPEGLPPGWEGLPGIDAGAEFHGHGSHHDWTVVEQQSDRVRLRIDYPADHPVAALERTVAGVPGRARLDMTLRILPRRDCRLSVALHPVLRLPETPGAAVLRAAFRFGRTLPVAAEPGVSRLLPESRFIDLAAVPAAAGGTLDLTHLPLAGRTEEIAQLCGSDGRAVLENRAEGYAVALDWDAALFPSLLLWVSNRGRSAWPWSGRHLALGMEPLRGAFDLGSAVGANPANPIAAEGVATALCLRAGEAVETRYAVTVAASV